MSLCNYSLRITEHCKIQPLFSAPLILLRLSFIRRWLWRNTFNICKQYRGLAGQSISNRESAKLFVPKFSLQSVCPSEPGKKDYNAHILALLNKNLCPMTHTKCLLLDLAIQCKKVIIFILIYTDYCYEESL